MTPISTRSLRLVPQPPAEVLAWLDTLTPDQMVEVSPAWLARVQEATEADPWTLGFSVLHRETGEAVGKCGFKGPPDGDGMVEIAYGIDPEHQGKGYATEAAEALVAFAFADARVRIARAHTMEAANASARVLTKCGFHCAGEVSDPEDGKVWRWELDRVRA